MSNDRMIRVEKIAEAIKTDLGSCEICNVEVDGSKITVFAKAKSKIELKGKIDVDGPNFFLRNFSNRLQEFAKKADKYV